jgi:hypothetical protein
MGFSLRIPGAMHTNLLEGRHCACIVSDLAVRIRPWNLFIATQAEFIHAMSCVLKASTSSSATDQRKEHNNTHVPKLGRQQPLFPAQKNEGISWKELEFSDLSHLNEGMSVALYIASQPPNLDFDKY